MEFPVGKLVALGDGNDVIHVRQKLQVFAREFFLVANHADDRDFLALGEMCGETIVFNKMLYFLDVFGRSMGFHYDNHIFFILFIFFMQQVKQKKITRHSLHSLYYQWILLSILYDFKVQKISPAGELSQKKFILPKKFQKLLVKIE